MAQYATIGEGFAAGIRSDGSPVVLMLYSALLQPLNEALVMHTTREQLEALRAAAAQQAETPPAVLVIIDVYIRLYDAIEGL